MSNSNINFASIFNLSARTEIENPDRSQRTKIRPTAYGWGLIFLLIWVPFTALATANNFLLIVFIMLVGTVLVSHSLAGKNVKSVTLIRRLPEEIYADTPFLVKYLVKSSRPIWGSLTLKFRETEPLESPLDQFPLPPVPPDKTVERSHSFTLTIRGWKQLNPGLLESSFPFGLAVYLEEIRF